MPQYNSSHDPRKNVTLSASSLQVLRSMLGLEYELYHFIAERQHRLSTLYLSGIDDDDGGGGGGGGGGGLPQ